MTFCDKLKQGKFVVTSEIGPPKGIDLKEMLDDADLVRPRVDAMNVTDLQSSVMRVGSLAICSILKVRGIEPVLQTEELDEATFKTNSAESNRVWIQGRPLEDWLGAEVGMSRCCDACGDSDCRTIEVGGRVYDTIPEDQIVKAGLIAASLMIGPSASELAQEAASCCADSTTSASCQPDRSEAKAGCCG